MNSLTTPSVAPDLATQRSTRPVRNPQMLHRVTVNVVLSRLRKKGLLEVSL